MSIISTIVFDVLISKKVKKCNNIGNTIKYFYLFYVKIILWSYLFFFLLSLILNFFPNLPDVAIDIPYCFCLLKKKSKKTSLKKIKKVSPPSDKSF